MCLSGNKVPEWFSGDVADEILLANRDHVVGCCLKVPEPRDMWRYKRVGLLPKHMVCRQWLRIGDVEGCSRKVVAAKGLVKVLRYNKVSPTSIDKVRPRLHGRKEVLVGKPACLVGAWKHACHHIDRPKMSMDVRQRDHACKGLVALPHATPHAPNGSTHGVHEMRKCRSDVSGAHDQDRLANKRVDRALVLPYMFPLIIAIPVMSEKLV